MAANPTTPMHDHDPNPPAQRRSKTRWVWPAAIVLVLLAWAGAFALRGGGEKQVLAGWQDGLDAGQAEAAALDRPMVLLFTAGWCGPCQQFKHDVLTRPAAEEALQARFVPVQIDLTDNSARNPNMQVATNYGVSRIPTVLALSKDGERIGSFKTQGTTVEGFVAWLDRVE